MRSPEECDGGGLGEESGCRARPEPAGRRHRASEDPPFVRLHSCRLSQSAESRDRCDRRTPRRPRAGEVTRPPPRVEGSRRRESTTVAPPSASDRSDRHSRSSVAASSAELGSSSASTRARPERSRCTARATATRCAWPPERPEPCTPSSSSGSANEASASESARTTRARSGAEMVAVAELAEGRLPSETLAATVPAISPGDWPAHASHRRGGEVADVASVEDRRSLEVGRAAQGGKEARLAGSARSLDEGHRAG